MNILVTGGAGFVGSHLCEFLINHNHCVYSLDNYFTGKLENHVPGINYIKGSTNEIEKLVDFPLDIIYHLGEYSRVEKSFEDSEIVQILNSMGTFSVVNFCKKNSIKLIYAGSSTKFGDKGLGPNQSPYAWTKSTNTQLIKNYGDWFGLSYSIIYLYNVYGGREISSGEYSTLIAIFKERFKKNLPLQVVSPGLQKRNFTHISDIVKGIALVGEFGHGDDYGIGHHESFSIIEVAKLFSDEIEMIPSRAGNRMDSPLVTKKIKKLGWKPEVGLEEYVKNFKKNEKI
tara:strand:- start:3150 stop:4007 length:858 start_codon:yes stop_codon:yes gene_type:complete